jgi:IS30 family transposase
LGTTSGWTGQNDHVTPVQSLIVGINARSAIGTLVERTTRYVMLLHLPTGTVLTMSQTR